MGRVPFSADEFIRELEELGEAEVRKRLALGRWGKVGTKFELVNTWLAQLDRANRAEAQSEEIEIARTAKDAAVDAANAASRAATAAERAADAAERDAETAERALTIAEAANTRATIALMLTAVIAIAAIIGLFLKGG